MPDNDFEAIVSGWAKLHSLRLFYDFSGRNLRYCYLSSEAGECFEIVVEPEEVQSTKVRVRSIETLDDVEIRVEWSVSDSELQVTLEAALDLVKTRLWQRQRLPRNWRNPQGV